MGQIKKATFAGGCFWCMVKPFDEYPGVLKIVSGYTGGHVAYPTYKEVCSDTTGHVEAVQITYDEDVLPYKKLVEIFFRSIDPTDSGGQFHDRGISYQTAIFYHDDDQKEVALKSIQDLEGSGLFEEPIVVPVRKASTFYEAEEIHQDYYKKNPFHYNLYYKGSGREAFLKKIWHKKHKNTEALKSRLTPIQYAVTQENATEKPYQNDYYDHFDEGIYVDIVSGEPLFSSKDKFNAHCGWPAFSKPIRKNAVYETNDMSHGMHRIEVRSEEADSHLGHVFEDGPRELGGLRYCINSAAIRFIPKEQMEEEGYGSYLELFNKNT